MKTPEPFSAETAEKDRLLPESKNTRALLRTMEFSVVGGFGFLAALAASLKPSPSGFDLHLSGRSMFAFGAGALVAYVAWKIGGDSLLSTQRKSGRVRLFTFILLAGGTGVFLYPLRFIPAERFPEVALGLGAAVCALSLVGYLIWQVKRFVDP